MNLSTENKKKWQSYDEIELKNKLSKKLPKIELFCFKSLNSTNDFLLSQIHHNHKKMLCVCDEQTQGRGRFNRKWQSEGLGQITLSYHHQSDSFLQSFQLLSIACALEVLLTLKKLGFENLKIKWPNDLYITSSKNTQFTEYKKLSGILIDSQVHRQKAQLVIGLGLNVFQNTNWASQGFGSLEMQSAQFTQFVNQSNKNDLALILVLALNQAITQLEKQNCKHYQKLFNQFDLLKNQNIHFQKNDGLKLVGRNLGIDKKARLKIKNSNGIKKLMQGRIVLV